MQSNEIVKEVTFFVTQSKIDVLSSLSRIDCHHPFKETLKTAIYLIHRDSHPTVRCKKSAKAFHPKYLFLYCIKSKKIKKNQSSLKKLQNETNPIKIGAGV